MKKNNAQKNKNILLKIGAASFSCRERNVAFLLYICKKKKQHLNFSFMKAFLPLLFALATLLVGCSQSNQSSQAIENSSKITSDKSDGEIIFQSDDDAPDAVRYAIEVIRSKFNQMTRFAGEPQYISNTDVQGRYKVTGQFLMANEGTDKLCYYSIYVQNFDSFWEFGTLIIGPKPNPTLASSQFTANGNMKKFEKANMTQQLNGNVGSLNYTIIKKNAPNYVRIYTSKRLSRNDVLSIYDKFKEEYEIVQFTTSRNPEDDEYLAIQYGSVYEFDIDKITKLANY